MPPSFASGSLTTRSERKNSAWEPNHQLSPLRPLPPRTRRSSRSTTTTPLHNQRGAPPALSEAARPPSPEGGNPNAIARNCGPAIPRRTPRRQKRRQYGSLVILHSCCYSGFQDTPESKPIRLTGRLSAYLGRHDDVGTAWNTDRSFSRAYWTCACWR